jgi:UDP-glucuronate 4-epimerase
MPEGAGPEPPALGSSTGALVTGAAGFIGSRLVERLALLGCRVTAIDALPEDERLADKRRTMAILGSLPGCVVERVDLRTDDLAPFLDGVDVVFHQAGRPGVRTSWDGFEAYVENNVVATKRLLDAATLARPRAFVYASSSSVYGSALRYPTDEDELPRPFSPYGVTKLAAEHLCGVYARNHDLATVSLRYFTVYGPRQRPDMAMHRLIEAALSGHRFTLFGDGQQVRDFTYVDDVVEANLRAAVGRVAPGTVLNVAGGASVSLLDVIALVEELSGRRVEVDRRGSPRGDVRRTGGSTARAHDLLGWSPSVSLGEGLAAQIAWQASGRAVATSS